MAAGKVLTCSACDRQVEAWDEGDPYFLDAQGEKQYAYHPDPQRALCTGLDVPSLCLHCGAETTIDAADVPAPCPQCGQREVVDLWELDGRTCPWCKTGTFAADLGPFMVS